MNTISKKIAFTIINFTFIGTRFQKTITVITEKVTNSKFFTTNNISIGK